MRTSYAPRRRDLDVRFDDHAVNVALYDFVSGPGEVPDDFDFRTVFTEIRNQTQLDSQTIRSFIADRALADAAADRLAANLDRNPHRFAFRRSWCRPRKPPRPCSRNPTPSSPSPWSPNRPPPTPQALPTAATSAGCPAG